MDTAVSGDKYLTVECLLTDIPLLPHVVKLSESVDFYGIDSTALSAPPVSGARVSISDGDEIVEFKEKSDGDKGTYYAPTGYCAKSGKTYHLHIEIDDPEGGVKEYNATSTMAESGCRLDAVDYKMINAVDSIYSISIWGEVFDMESYLLAIPFINTNIFPLSSAFGLENKYYRGKYLSAFPMAARHYVSWAAYESGKEYRKPFEEGDIVGVGILSLSKDFYDYFVSYMFCHNSGSIPLITSQPANLPTNIEGENAAGYFTTAPVQLQYCTVDDPYRRNFLVE